MELELKNSAIIKQSQPETEENWHVSTWGHRAWFAIGCATAAFAVAKSFMILTAGAPTGPRPWLWLMAAAFAGYVAADLKSGIYHWAIDNYGSPQTPFFGSHVEGFLYHHQHPSAITKRELANNLHHVGASVVAMYSPINLLCNDPFVLLFFGVLEGSSICIQLFHAWAHTPKGKLPWLVVVLQDAGIILSRAEHAAHHRSPYNGNYCILTGWCNRVLDQSKFFVALEVVVARVLGHKPRSWSVPDPE